MHLCALYGSRNKQRLFPHTMLTKNFSQPRDSVFTAGYELMVQAVSRSPFSVEAWARSQICGSQSGSGKDFAVSTVGFRLSVLFHQCAILTFFLKSLSIGQKNAYFLKT